MDGWVRKAGFVILTAISALTLFASLWQHASDARLFGPVALAFDPIVVFGSFLLGVFVSLLFQWGIDFAHFEKILKLLPSGQQKVLTVLSGCKSATMEHLCYVSRLPKATVSKVLAMLQAKDVIRRISGTNAMLVESRLHIVHQASEAIRRLPGFSERRLIAALGAVFLWGITLTLLNSYHVTVLESPFPPATYALSIEFVCLGALSSLLTRRLIAKAHFDRAIRVLPEDEQLILRHIFQVKSITQNELVQRTGIYKMKVSRILRKFQEKGLIDRISYGYTNLIVSKI